MYEAKSMFINYKKMEYKLAKKVIEKMIKSSEEYNELLIEIQKNCSPEEFKIYQQGFGKILGYMLLDVMNPVFKEYPELKPKGLK